MQNNKKLKIVIDTNVWISALVFGGQPGQVLKLFIDDEITVVISEEILSELHRKITQKFPLFMPNLGLLMASLRQDAEIVGLGSQTVDVSRDPDDNKVIETALVGSCDYIVSGDKDLLVLGSFQGLKIIKPSELINKVENQN